MKLPEKPRSQKYAPHRYGTADNRLYERYAGASSTHMTINPRQWKKAVKTVDSGRLLRRQRPSLLKRIHIRVLDLRAQLQLEYHFKHGYY